MRYCLECGAELPARARFCAACGAAVDAVEEAAAPVSEGGPDNEESQYDGYYDDVEPADSRPTERRLDKRLILTICGAAAGVAALIALSVLAIRYL